MVDLKSTKNVWLGTMKEEKKKQNKENADAVPENLGTDKKEIEELKELLQRTQANFENYRKMQEKRLEEIKSLASRDLILKLLPLLDNFSLILKNSGNSAKEDLLQGIELIYAQFNSLLEEQGIMKISLEKNQKFDPYLHEALLKSESDLPEGIILEELQTGYTLHGKILRHAKVKISSGKKDTKENKTEKTENRK